MKLDTTISNTKSLIIYFLVFLQLVQIKKILKSAVMLMLKQRILLGQQDAIGTPNNQMIVECTTMRTSKPKNYVVHANNMECENWSITEHFIYLQIHQKIKFIILQIIFSETYSFAFYQGYILSIDNYIDLVCYFFIFLA